MLVREKERARSYSPCQLMPVESACGSDLLRDLILLGLDPNARDAQNRRIYDLHALVWRPNLICALILAGYDTSVLSPPLVTEDVDFGESPTPEDYRRIAAAALRTSAPHEYGWPLFPKKIR